MKTWRASKPRSGCERTAFVSAWSDRLLRPRQSAQGRGHRSQCRRDRRTDRRQRRRQIHIDDDGLRQSTRARRRDRLRRPRHHPSSDPRNRPTQTGAGAGRPAHIPAHDRAGKPADGRARRRPCRVQRRSRARARAVLAVAPAPAPARRHAFGRRAADAGDRAGADEPAAAASPGRAFAWARPADRAADFRCDQNAQCRARPHRVSGRAERVPRAQARPSRLCYGQRTCDPVRHRPRIARAAGGQIGLSRRRTPAGRITVNSLNFISGLVYEEDSLGVFLLVTVILGGGAAALAGRAVALTWRPWWQVVVYMLMLSAAVRFIHFALFGGSLLSIHYYAVDSLVCMVLGFAGFQAARARRMVAQYPWINEPDGPLRWRRKPH